MEHDEMKAAIFDLQYRGQQREMQPRKSGWKALPWAIRVPISLFGIMVTLFLVGLYFIPLVTGLMGGGS